MMEPGFLPPNKITGPNAGGPRQFPIPTPLAARVGQFWRSAYEIKGSVKTISPIKWKSISL
jgi:hypothetical protein